MVNDKDSLLIQFSSVIEANCKHKFVMKVERQRNGSTLEMG